MWEYIEEVSKAKMSELRARQKGKSSQGDDGWPETVALSPEDDTLILELLWSWVKHNNLGPTWAY